MYDKILVPIDGSPTSQCGLKEAIKIAKSQGSIVRLLHVVNEFMFDYTYSSGMNTTTVIDALRDAGKRILADAEAAVRQAIIAQAGSWPAELIVMGTHGRRGLARVAMGSDAEEVVRASPVPVLLVRGQLSAQAHASRAAA